MSLSAITPVGHGPRIPVLEIRSDLMDYLVWRAQLGRANRDPSVIHRSQRLTCIIRQTWVRPWTVAQPQSSSKVPMDGPFWPPAEQDRLQKSLKFSILAEFFEGYHKFKRAIRWRRAGLDGGLQHQPGWANDKNVLCSRSYANVNGRCKQEVRLSIHPAALQRSRQRRKLINPSGGECGKVIKIFTIVQWWWEFVPVA